MSKIDFQWWGRTMLIVALLIGLYLSRHASECFLEYVRDFKLAGEVDDGKAVFDEKGEFQGDPREGGNYAKNFQKGSGFFAYMAGSAKECVDRSSFRDPRWAFLAFWGLICLGLLCQQVLGRIFKPEWKKNISKRAREEEALNREREESQDAQRQARTRAASRQVEAIDVGGIDLGGSPERKPSPPKRDQAPRGLMGGEPEPEPTPAPPRREETPRPPEPAMNTEKRDRLSALGIGGDDDSSGWLDSGSLDQGDDASFGGDPLGLEDPLDAASYGADEAERSGFPALRDAEGAGDWHLRDADSPHSLLSSGPESRAVSFGEPDTAGMSRSQRAPSAFLPTERRRYWLPMTRQDDELLFVGPTDYETEGDPDAGQSEEHPLSSVLEALERARPLLAEGLKVQIRLLPGIYRERVELPAGVALVNHAIPRGMSQEEMRFWLTEEKQGYDTRVILTLPNNAPDDAWTLRLCGDDIFLAGLHIVGRGTLNDSDALSAGVQIEDVPEATLYLCYVLGHRTHHPGAGLQLRNSGQDAERRVLVQDCLFEDNATSDRGGAIWAEGSSVAFLGCGIQANESGTAGGGLYLGPNRLPVLLDRCLVSRNEVRLSEELPRASRGGWSGEVGHGGGIYVHQGEVHLRVSDLLDNTAQGAGGAIFASASVLLMEGDPASLEISGRVGGNRALRGGGVLLSGPPAHELSDQVCALRAQSIEFLANEAVESGGAIACFRLAQLDLQHCTLRQNRATSEYGEGGGLHANLGSRVKLRDSIIEQNEAPFRGGGLSISNSSLRLFDGCAIRENKSGGDSGGVAFYSMTSNYLDDLRGTGRLEEPLICAIGDCEIRDNTAQRGVAGLFIGNFVREDTAPIIFTLKAHERIKLNLLPDSDGQLKPRQKHSRNRPVDFLVAWQGVVQGDEHRPPTGRRILGSHGDHPPQDEQASA